MALKKIDSKGFLDAAKSNVEPELKEALNIGETGWLRGSPTKSENGTIALKNQEGFLMIVSEGDVVEYARHEDEFFVRVKNGADVLTRFESVNKLLPSKPPEPCSCHGKEKTQSMALRLGNQGGPPNEPLGAFLCWACWITYVEGWCSLPGGYKFKCYQPQIQCGNICPPIIWT